MPDDRTPTEIDLDEAIEQEHMAKHRLAQAQSIHEHTSDLVDEYTAEITAWADEKVPPILTNSEYAARTSALVIALSRQLGRAAAAFGEAQQCPSEEVGQMVVTMFL